MAKPITDDEIQLRKRARRRLVGAIALVLVVVVVLPWLVDDEPPPQLKNVDISIPPVDKDASGTVSIDASNCSRNTSLRSISFKPMPPPISASSMNQP